MARRSKRGIEHGLDDAGRAAPCSGRRASNPARRRRTRAPRPAGAIRSRLRPPRRVGCIRSRRPARRCHRRRPRASRSGAGGSGVWPGVAVLGHGPAGRVLAARGGGHDRHGRRWRRAETRQQSGDTETQHEAISYHLVQSLPLFLAVITTTVLAGCGLKTVEPRRRRPSMPRRHRRPRTSPPSSDPLPLTGSVFQPQAVPPPSMLLIRPAKKSTLAKERAAWKNCGEEADRAVGAEGDRAHAGDHAVRGGEGRSRSTRRRCTPRRARRWPWPTPHRVATPTR